jgi:hypothetical protein
MMSQRRALTPAGRFWMVTITRRYDVNAGVPLSVTTRMTCAIRAVTSQQAALGYAGAHENNSQHESSTRARRGSFDK